MKTYRFIVPAVYYNYGYVIASSIEEAKQKIINNEYDDILDSEFKYHLREGESFHVNNSDWTVVEAECNDE